jgi:hypothetical protein
VLSQILGDEGDDAVSMACLTRTFLNAVQGGFVRSTWFEGGGVEHTTTEGAIYVSVSMPWRCIQSHVCQITIEDNGMMDSQVVLNELCVFWVTLHWMDYDITAGSPEKVRI